MYASSCVPLKHNVFVQGLVDICSKVPYFSVQALDMLLPQLTSIPALAVENFVDAAKDGVRTKIPVAQMVNVRRTDYLLDAYVTYKL